MNDERILSAVTVRPWYATLVELLPFAALLWFVIVAANVFSFTHRSEESALANLGHLGQIVSRIPRNVTQVFGLLAVLAAPRASG